MRFKEIEMGRSEEETKSFIVYLLVDTGGHMLWVVSRIILLLMSTLHARVVDQKS